jgi:hypothetical protein
MHETISKADTREGLSSPLKPLSRGEHRTVSGGIDERHRDISKGCQPGKKVKALKHKTECTIP